MPQVINTNVPSPTSQRALNLSRALQVSLQRLLPLACALTAPKTMQRALQFPERMTSPDSWLNQAARNANDGISLSQTAEGGLRRWAIEQCMRELSVQAANGTNST